MLDYDFTDRALRDLASARAWYDRQDPKLGNQFIDDVLAAIRVARTRPISFPEIANGIRGVRCSRFPYRVYYDVQADRIQIAAVYHTARDPSRWNDPDRE
jgi:toxin ParE1/3/4